MLMRGFGIKNYRSGIPIDWLQKGRSSEWREADILRCVCAFFLPVIPLEAFHFYFDDDGEPARVDIRKTPGFLFRTMARSFLWIFCGVSGFFAATLLLHIIIDKNAVLEFIVPIIAASGLVFFISVLALGLLRRKNVRGRNIRLVTGKFAFGASDPVTWTDDNFEFAGYEPGFENELDYSAALAKLHAKDFENAMIDARLAAAKKLQWGESLTDKILSNPDVAANLRKIRRKPWLREEYFN